MEVYHNTKVVDKNILLRIMAAACPNINQEQIDGKELVLQTVNCCAQKKSRQMAKAGFLTIMPDLRAFGERSDGLNPFPVRDKCNTNFIKGAIMGVWILALNIWDMKCCSVLEVCYKSKVDTSIEITQ